MSLDMVTIEVIDADARRPKGKLPQYLYAQFNPTEYALAKGAQIAEIGIYGIDSPVLQFIRGQNEKLTMDFFFDTTDDGMGDAATSVTTLTDPFYQLVKIQPHTHAPPRVKVTWGQGLAFDAIVESVSRKFTLFNPHGLPLRATLSVSFREYKSLEKQLAELKLSSADHTKRRVVERGDTLSRIAAQEYGDPTLWRVIADENTDILANPRQLAPGTVLAIPPIEVNGRGATGTR